LRPITLLGKSEMHFDRSDIRGLVMVAAFMAFGFAVASWVQTRDLPADIIVGKGRLAAPQIGDEGYYFYFWLWLSVSVALAAAAKIRRLWE
jgi:hypothetical protein